MADELELSAFEERFDVYDDDAEVPRLLRRLASENDGPGAADEIALRSLHQGFLTEMTAPVTAHYLKVRDTAQSVLPKVYLYLEHLADAAYGPARNRFIPEETYDAWRREVQSSLEQGKSRLLEMCESDDPFAIRAAAALLDCIDRDGHELNNALVAALETCSDPAGRAAVWLSVGKKQGAVPRLRQAVKEELDPLSRFAAALRLAAHDGAATPDENLTFVLAPLFDQQLAGNWAEIDSVIQYPCLFEGLYPALASVGAERVLPLLVDRLRADPTPTQSHNLVRLFLGLLLGPGDGIQFSSWSTRTGYVDLSVSYSLAEGARRPVFKLTPEQKASLDQLCRLDAVWLVETNLWALYGLRPTGFISR